MALTAAAIDTWPCAGLRLDRQGRITALNSELALRLGCQPDAFAGQTLEALLSPSSRMLWASALWPALQARQRIDDAALELQTPTGPWRVAAALRFEPPGPQAGITAWLLPAAERQRLQDELRSARRSLDAIPGAVLQCCRLPSGNLTFAYASAGVLDLLGVTPTQVVAHGSALLAALTPASRIAFEASLAEAEEACVASWRVIVHAARTPTRALEWVAQRQLSAAGAETWHGVLLDVSERERLQLALREQTSTDELTRLPNRRGLLLQLQQAIDTRRLFALLFMDVDRFKQINDSLGHEAGDELLREIAHRLRRAVRPADRLLQLAAGADAASVVVSHAGMPSAEPLAARLGGDEFVVLALGVADAASAAALAERLLIRLSQPHQLGGMQVHSSVSIGIALGHGGSTSAQLMRDADTAMYEAKRQGRGRYAHFEADMSTRANTAFELEADLRTALVIGQLRTVFQPIVEIGSGRVVGMEALARWRHPSRGEISPVQFVPVAEDSGLIVALGEEILRQSCVQFRAWQVAGLPLPARVSVNLSRAQLLDPALPQRVQAIVEAAGLACSALQFELTESLASQDDAARSMLGALRALGIQLALDDFGTGHSSLSALQHFPVQQLKIDRSFVRELETSAYHRALVQAALQVAQALQLEVVAEGVETESQARLLAELGCSRAQGYLYARPLEAEAMSRYLAEAAQRAPGRPPSTELSAAAYSRAHMVVITDASGLTVYVNPAFSLNTGFTLDDLQGRKLGHLMQGPDTDPQAVQRLRDAVAGGQGCQGVEILNYRKDGSMFWVLVDIEPVRNPEGRIERFVSVQTEITQQRQAQAELAGLRERIAHISQLGLVGFWERNLLTDQGTSDATSLRLLGLPVAGPTPDWGAMMLRVTPETRPALQAYFDTLRAGASQGMAEYSVRHDDGRVLHLQTHWTRDGDRALGLLVDVSGTQQLRHAREQLLQQLELAAVAANQFFWRHDLASGQVEWLPANGHPYPVDAEGRSHDQAILQAVLPADRSIVAQARQDALQAVGVVEAVYRVRNAQGDVRHLLTRRIALRDDGGTVRQLLGVSIDISSERQQQAALQSLAQQNALVVEAAKLAPFRLDLQAWRYHFDSAFAQLYGLPDGSTELAWDDWLARVHPDDLPGVRQRVRRLSTAPSVPPTRSRFRVRTAGGEWRRIDAHLHLLRDAEGTLLAAVGAHRDITEEVQAADTAQALAAEQAARAERALLMSGASHELRTPLNAVLGFTHLLSAGLAGPQSDKAQRYLAGIEEAGRLLLRLSDDFGQLSALDAGRARLVINPVALAPLLRSVLDMVEPQAQAAGIRLVLSDDALGGCALADEQRLRQVLLNLLSNAIKYNRPGGQVRLGSLMSGERWLISVEDTGLGMEQSQLARLFTAFERAGREASAIAGSGLGLVLSRGWMRAMGGDITVASTPGSGSGFTLDLPAETLA